jgi:CDGSH-type Zn-finger protein
VIETVRKCPSGALSYSIDGIEYRDQDRKPMITVSKDGPYIVIGGIALMGNDSQFGQGASKEHYTLCRCGASKNKPFCDGAHREINFKDEKD